MMLVPLRVDLALQRFPVLTLLVCFLCIAVHQWQYMGDKRMNRNIAYSCDTIEPDMSKTMRWFDMRVDQQNCVDLMGFVLWGSPWSTLPRKVQMSHLIEGSDMTVSGVNYSDLARQTLEERRESFVNIYGEKNVSQSLMYYPRSWNPLKMVTAALSHGGFNHLFGNLLFFFIFGAVVEAILGVKRYLGLLFALALGTHICYSMFSLSNNIPTLGLSGVVYGVMGAYIFFLPRSGVKSFVWILVWISVRIIPAYFLIAYFVGQDVWTLYHKGMNTGVNLIAHISGAAIGFGMSLLLFRQQKADIGEIE